MIDILYFPDNFIPEIISGITLKGKDNKYPHGFSINQAEIYSAEEAELMHHDLSMQLHTDKSVFMHQTHSDVVEIYDGENLRYNSDAIITDKPNILINISVADCAGIILFDTQNKVLAGIHSGWKGTKANITGKTIQKMSQHFGSNPANIKCIISPCASLAKYEVGQEFLEYFPDNVQKRGEKYFFDNKTEITQQLLTKGIMRDNIYVSSECTIGNSKFHSYRRDKQNSGRMSVLGIIK